MLRKPVKVAWQTHKRRNARCVPPKNEFGTQIATGDVVAETEFTGTYTYELSSELENFEIAAILWNYDGSNYQFVNAYSTDDPVIPEEEPNNVADITLARCKNAN